MKTAEERLIAVKTAEQEERVRSRGLVERDAKIFYLEKKMGLRGPTKETKGKIREHAIEKLRRKNIIDDAQERALSDIEDGFRLITFGARVRMSSPEKIDAGSGSQADHDTELVIDYMEWRRALPLKMCMVCLDCAVEGMYLPQLAEKHRCRWETAKELLLEGLDEFALIRTKNYHERNRLKPGMD